MDKHRKLVILGLNKLLSQNLISLTPTKGEAKSGYIFAELAGHSSVVMWQDIGHDEIRISVWWKYAHNKHPHANLTGASQEKFNTSKPLCRSTHYPKFIGVAVSAWLERKTGKYLQGHGHDRLFAIYTRKGEQSALAALPEVAPQGYAAESQLQM